MKISTLWLVVLQDICIGFHCSLSDGSLFYTSHLNITTIILVYVDYIFLTRNTDAFLHNLFNKLSQEFAIKDLGSPHYFLGVEVKPLSGEVILVPTQLYI